MPQVLTFGSALFRVPTVAFVVVACLGAWSCTNSEQTWFAQARSPDGKFIATARTLQPGGWGTGSPPETSVDLDWVTGSQKPAEIFQFVGNVDHPDDMKVEMVWLTPTHLQITYRPNRIIQFQAVRCFDVDISARQAGGGSTR